MVRQMSRISSESSTHKTLGRAGAISTPVVGNVAHRFMALHRQLFKCPRLKDSDHRPFDADQLVVLKLVEYSAYRLPRRVGHAGNFFLGKGYDKAVIVV